MRNLPIVDYTSAPFNGPFAFDAHLMDGVTAGPYEGLWVPVPFAKRSSIEITGTFTALDCALWGTNQTNPLNTYLVTVGGTAQDGDILQLSLGNPNLTAGQVQAIAYTLAGSASLNSAAAALALAVANNANLGALGFKATATGAVVAITWPSVSPNAPAPATPSSPPLGSPTTLAVSVGGSGPTTTLAVGLGTDGASIAVLPSAGIIANPATPYCRYVKARLNSLTGSTVTGRISGSA